MKDVKRSFAFAGAMTAAQAADYLEGMAKAIRAGVLTLENGRQVLGLAPTGVVSIEVEAKRKGDEEKVEVEIQWRRAAVLAPPALKISDQAPPEPAPEPEEIPSVDSPEASAGDVGDVGEHCATEEAEGEDEGDEDEESESESKREKKKKKKKRK